MNDENDDNDDDDGYTRKHLSLLPSPLIRTHFCGFHSPLSLSFFILNTFLELQIRCKRI